MGAGQQSPLSRWFDNFRKMKAAAASINGTLIAMDLLTFAGTNILQVLPSANDQNQFILNCNNSLQLQIPLAHLTTYPTFKQLMDHFSLLAMKVEDFLQPLAGGNYPNGSQVDFDSAAVTDAFPGGGAGTLWTAANRALTGAIPAECFTGALQAKTATIVGDATKKVADLVKQIAGLG